MTDKYTNPSWTKRRIRNNHDLEHLADHIVSRTPPKSYNNMYSLFIAIVKRNQSALGTWAGGYEKLTALVHDKLIERDGSL